MEEHRFGAMGTTVTLLVDAPRSPATSAALARAEDVFARVEHICSRFDERSELTRLNRLGAARVSPLLAELVGLALAARERTAGLFDPTVHDAVVAAGYDRSFDALADAGEDPSPAAGPSGPSRCGGAVELHADRVVLGAGVRLDLGGIAKGYAADAACATLAAAGPCVVDAGGDVAVAGSWPIAVDGGPVLELTDAAVATSGRDRRTWERDGEHRHHLIDPRTGSPALTATVRATVVASTAVEAEVLAKAAFLGAPPSAPTVLVREDGTTTLSGGLT